MFHSAVEYFCNQLNIRLPIIQAPMAGGIVTPSLISEVTLNGGLGSLPLGYLSIAESQKAIREIKTLISAPFAVNIFIPDSKSNRIQETQFRKIFDYINVHRARVGLNIYSEIPIWVEPDTNELVEMIIGEGISALSFTFGILNSHLMSLLKRNHIFVMGTATTVAEGLALESAGCDAVIAQGAEAGGHRGGDFLEGNPGELIGTMALVPQMVDALTVPVIASGGIMDGRGLVAALVLGASAVQMGTAFLTCDESNTSSMHQQKILEGHEDSTCITSVFTGKPVRCFKNEFVFMTEQQFHNNELLPYPLQHQLTKELRRHANTTANVDYSGLWSGQGIRLSRSVSTRVLMSTLEKEVAAVLSQFKIP